MCYTAPPKVINTNIPVICAGHRQSFLKCNLANYCSQISSRRSFGSSQKWRLNKHKWCIIFHLPARLSRGRGARGLNWSPTGLTGKAVSSSGEAINSKPTDFCSPACCKAGFLLLPSEDGPVSAPSCCLHPPNCGQSISWISSASSLERTIQKRRTCPPSPRVKWQHVTQTPGEQRRQMLLGRVSLFT